ncbi:MAG: hypothetical protein U5L09_09730 [Bacteroidales bacterium]|nr:hypothetical protein [Bacteroidales bacterium]
MLLEDLHQKHVAGFQNYIFAGNAKQLKRLSTIFEDMQADKQEKTTFHPVNYSIHEGFI